MSRLLAATAVLALAVAQGAQAAISYTTTGSTYTENFNGLPTDLAVNANIQAAAAYADGWQDDVNPAVSTQADISVPGWHLYHPLAPATGTPPENGFNDHQRVRVGTGGTNTGSFWLYGATGADPEKALGGLGSTTIAANNASTYMGLQLTNNTGQTLTTFSITYDGEKWRQGDTTGESLVFGYSTSATEADWFLPATPFAAEATLNFTPSTAFTNNSAVDGNSAGLIANITGSVGGLNWLNGTDLWIRFADLSIAGNDDGLAIDNFRFSANVGGGPVTDITSVQSGSAFAAGTWSNNEAPSAANHYRIVSPHQVSLNDHFPGGDIRIQTGGTLNYTASAKKVTLLIVDAGGTLTESVSGDFALGDISQPLGTLQLEQDTNFTIDASSNFYLDMKLVGDAALNFNGAAGSTLWLSDTVGHTGTIRFNGSGSQVNITESNGGVGTLEMNSTGANRLFYDPKVQADAGTVIFNQPGTIDHAATSTTPLRRLHGVGILQANAAVTVDLTKIMPDGAEERRFLVGSSAGTGLAGSGAITVNGTPGNGHVAGGVTLNEFENGSTGEPGTLAVDTYTGTLTANDYVNVEIRHSQPGAKFVVGNHAVLEMGHQTIATAHTIAFGEVAVNNGGILEIGFEQGNGTIDGHHVGHLRVTDDNGRNGNLTLNDGATLRMQVNGLATTQFDTIEAEGAVVLNGTLDILVNPLASTGDNPIYAPAINDVFTIITSSAGALASDFDGANGVNGADFAIWKGAFGTSSAGDTDDDGDSDGVDFLKWQSEFGATGGGGISGAFDAVTITDPSGAMAGKTFQVLVSSSSVQLKVVSAVSAVPEPTGLAIAAASLLLPAIRRRYNRA